MIREALSLILQALRLSDNAPEALASALQRWATALSAALLDNRDLRQLLFLIHHLFRSVTDALKLIIAVSQRAIKLVYSRLISNVFSLQILSEYGLTHI